MWTPDIRTIFLLIFLLNGFLTLMILAYWKTQKTYEGFALWAVSLLFQSLAYLLFMLRGEVSDLLSIPVANMLNMLAMILRVDAIRRFIWLKPVHTGFYLLLIPIFFTYWYFTYIVDSIILRALISTLFVAPCLMIAGILALRSRERENRIIRYLFAATLTIPALLLIARLAAWLVVPEQYTLFSTDAVQYRVLRYCDDRRHPCHRVLPDAEHGPVPEGTPADQRETEPPLKYYPARHQEPAPCPVGLSRTVPADSQRTGPCS